MWHHANQFHGSDGWHAVNQAENYDQYTPGEVGNFPPYYQLGNNGVQPVMQHGYGPQYATPGAAYGYATAYGPNTPRQGVMHVPHVAPQNPSTTSTLAVRHH